MNVSFVNHVQLRLVCFKVCKFYLKGKSLRGGAVAEARLAERGPAWTGSQVYGARRAILFTS